MEEKAMNERVKELWFNAKGYYRSGNQHDWPVYVIDNPQQFAELIIKECIDVCIALQDVPASEPRHCAQDIKIHFGIVDG